MFWDPRQQPLTERVSPPGIEPGTERVFVLAKPDALRQNLLLNIIVPFRAMGLDLEGPPRLIWATRAQVGNFLNWSYTSVRQTGICMVKHHQRELQKLKDHFGTTDPLEIAWIIRSYNIEYLHSGVMAGMIFHGAGALKKGKVLKEAIRKVWAEPGGRDRYYLSGTAHRNVVHVTKDVEEFERDACWFAGVPTYEPVSRRVHECFALAA